MKRTFCDRCGREILDEHSYSIVGREFFRWKFAFARSKKEHCNVVEHELCATCQHELEHWWQKKKNIPSWRFMLPNKDLIKGLKWILEDDKFGFGQNWDSIDETECEEELAGYYIERAIKKLEELQDTEDDRK